MKRLTSRTTVLTMAVAASLAVGACGGTPAADPDQLRVAYGAYPTCLDYAQSNPFALFGRQVADTLVARDPQSGKFQPYLAESWRVSDGGRTYDFTIRQGVTFSNGEALTPAVVARNFTTLWEMAQRGTSPTPGAYLQGFDGAHAIDDRTVRVQFTRPNAGFLEANTEGQFGIIAPESLDRTPEQRCASGTIGSGPFVLERAVPDERLEYRRRSGYTWGPAAFGTAPPEAFSRLTVQIVPEESERAAGVVSGNYDLGYSIQQKGLQQAAGNPDVEPRVAPNKGVINTFIPNTSDPTMADTAVRRAIQRGIDRSTLARVFYGPGIDPASDVVSRGHPSYRDRGSLLRFDPDESRRVLDTAGWTPGPDGIRVKDGTRLAITLSYAADDIGSAATGWEYVQTGLRDIGVDLQLQPISDARQTDLRTSGRWQLTVDQGASRGDADGIAAFYSTKLSVFRGLAPRPEVDDALAAQATIISSTERAAIVDRAVTRILDEGYGIPLFDSAQVLLVNKSVRNLRFPLNSWEPIFATTTKA